MMEKVMAPLSEFLAAQMGLHYPRERWPDLQRGLGAAASELGFDDPAACAHWLMGAPLSPDQIAILAGHLTIGETYFWREHRHFQVLEENLLPALIAARRETGERRLRLWSAGCCTGEEPNSLAILLHRLLPDLADWNITILATDLNPRFLEKAQAGHYGEWSFRDAPVWLKERFFTAHEKGRYKIAPHIQQMVSFARLNLAEDSFPSLLNNTNAMDVILCRNVLMYFSETTREKIVGNFNRCLVEDGWLIVAPSETSQPLYSPLATVNFPGAILYRKESSQTTARAIPPKIFQAPIRSTPVPLVRSTPAPLRSTPAPSDVNIYEQAQSLYEQGCYAEAATALRGVNRELKPPENALLARVLANQGTLGEALGCCEQAIAGDKLSAGYCYLRATILQEQGALDEAAQSLKRALYLDHDFVLAHFALGNLAERQGQNKEAKRQFANALQLSERRPPEEILPESEGITAGRLVAIIKEMTSTRQAGREAA